MNITPEQQFKYAQGQLVEELNIYNYYASTVRNPPSDVQIVMMRKQAARVERWRQEIDKL